MAHAYRTRFRLPLKFPSDTGVFYAVVDCASITETLFDCCTPATIYSLGQTCRVVHLISKDYCRRRFDIDKHLKPFFPNVFRFRALQAKTNCIISGSSALQFMARVEFSTSDLDVFVASSHAQTVCDWLLRDSDAIYKFLPSHIQQEKGFTNPEEVISRFRWSDSPRMIEGPCTIDLNFTDAYGNIQVLNFVSTLHPNRKIQVIMTHCTPIDCVLSFHSSKNDPMASYEGEKVTSCLF